MTSNLRELATRLGLRLRHRMPVVLQSEVAECGLACISMVASWYRLPADLFSLRQTTSLSSRGTTLRTLMATASTCGLKSRPVKLDMENLPALKVPCILHWDMTHFVVLVSVGRKLAVIHDPAYGRRVMALEDVSRHFTGVALEMWPSGDVSPEMSGQSRLLKLSALTGRISGLGSVLTKLFCFSLLIESVNLLLPAGMQLVMDHVIPASDTGLLTLICLSLLFMVIFRTLVSMLRGWTSLVMTTLIDIQWKSRLFDRLMALPLAYFENRKLGDIQSRFTSLDTLRTTLTTNVVNSIMDGIMTLGLIVMITLYGGWLVWIVLGFALVRCLFRLVSYEPYRLVSEEQIVGAARGTSHFMETLYGISTVKSLGLAERRAEHWLNLNVAAGNANVRKTRFEMLFSGGNSLLSSLEQVSVLWLGAHQVIIGNMTLGMFVALTTYRGQFAERAANLLDMALQLRMLSLHKTRVADIALTKPETAVSAPPQSLVRPGEPASLQIKDLSFQYDALSNPLFSGFHLHLVAGESVAITGPSGRGKTTLMKIMAGLLQPSGGDIFINGISIYTVGLNNYRRSIACVLQDDTLFAGTIADNLCASDPDIAHMQDCAQRCSIHEDILRMPMGYQTQVSELGGSLSGGQKQRILIARAIYTKPSILFLDEATSHLDEENEKRINTAVRSLNITRLIIAHRPSTIASADRVIRLN